jgi:hypothetical protein
VGLMSWPIAHAAWVRHADAVLGEPEPVVVLGIDETHRDLRRLVLAQSIAGWTTYNEDQLRQRTDIVTWPEYLSFRTSGAGRCRTGSPSSSPSAPCGAVDLRA